MNDKIPFNRFAAMVAEAASVSTTGAETFCREFFATIADALLAGEIVNIKGFGTFSLSGNPDRPVNFTPDPNVADTINAPFAMFRPEPLAPGVTVDTAEPQPAAQTPQAPAVPPTPAPKAGARTATPPVPAVPADRVPPTPAPSPKPEPKPQPKPEPAVPAIEPATPAIEPVPEPELNLAEPAVNDSPAPTRGWIWLLFGFLIGLAVGAFGVFIYMTSAFSSPAAQSAADSDSQADSIMSQELLMEAEMLLDSVNSLPEPASQPQ